MLKIIFTIFISLIANETFAVCSSVAIDDNSRIISLAKDFADQADFEFKKANTLRGCELLHVSRSFISQSDNQKLSNQISNLYDKRCSKITIQNI
ncbi:hypothetical protein LBMAG29_03240 [Methylophilaceae bacterium]|jgi:hypothetical protein|nr:hypothetical protein [Candidatus Methylopumilus sp.]GDX55014.1 hypothetical protein LBMAG29_03240 [Methylophilaceae bacterium]